MSHPYDDHEVENQYDELLDEMYGDVLICGYVFSSSRALKELDPIAYRCGLLDFEDMLDQEYEEDCLDEDFDQVIQDAYDDSVYEPKNL